MQRRGIQRNKSKRKLVCHLDALGVRNISCDESSILARCMDAFRSLQDITRSKLDPLILSNEQFRCDSKEARATENDLGSNFTLKIIFISYE
mmetsp:Transcript_28655/g.60477  ORF Transcript_28655/g.60477 Transcript_28655/m.60477 type:complete len:92 (+) Transcript_28655:2188-2463(+)